MATIPALPNSVPPLLTVIDRAFRPRPAPDPAPPIVKKRTHGEIIELGIKLGYFEDKDRRGVCQGATMAWLASCLTDRVNGESYLRFTTKITEEGPALFDKIQAMRSKVFRNEALPPKDKKALTPEEIELFQYLAFYEQITLYMFPERYQTLFTKPITQRDVGTISNVANSVALEQQGGISIVYSEPGIYTTSEFAAYLTEIAESTDTDTGTIALLLNSYNHAIGLTYTPSTRCWRCMDINSEKPQELGVDVDKLASQVLTGMNPTHDSAVWTALNTQAIIAADSLKSALFIEKLQALKMKHRVSPELATRIGNDGVSLLWMAVKHGHIEAVRTLLENGAEVNQSATINGATPLYMALYMPVQESHIDIIQALLTAGARLNKQHLDEIKQHHAASYKMYLTYLTAEAIQTTQMLLSPNPCDSIDTIVERLQGKSIEDIDLIQQEILICKDLLQRPHGLGPLNVNGDLSQSIIPFLTDAQKLQEFNNMLGVIHPTAENVAKTIEFREAAFNAREANANQTEAHKSIKS